MDQSLVLLAGGSLPHLRPALLACRCVQGYAWVEDKEHCEEQGRMMNADASAVSDRAKQRGLTQVPRSLLCSPKFDRLHRPISGKFAIHYLIWQTVSHFKFGMGPYVLSANIMKCEYGQRKLHESFSNA